MAECHPKHVCASCARRVHALITEEYGATGANVAVQDGAAAGQSVPHAHVHVLPRR